MWHAMWKWTHIAVCYAYQEDMHGAYMAYTSHGPNMYITSEFLFATYQDQLVFHVG